MKVLFLGGPEDGQTREVDARNWRSLPPVVPRPEASDTVFDAGHALAGAPTHYTRVYYHLRWWRKPGQAETPVYAIEGYAGPGPA